MMRLLAILLLVCSAGAVTAQGTTRVDPDREVSVELRIGVRGSARPFSYYTSVLSPNISTKSGPLRAKGYDGYMVYICDEVLKQMLIDDGRSPPLHANQIKTVNIDTTMAARRALAQKETTDTVVLDRFDLLGEEVDILCDPASITRDRVRQFAVSPPLFMTGVGYLSLRHSVPPSSDTLCRPDKALMGFVGTTNALTGGVQSILDAGEWKKYRDQIITALRNPTAARENCPPPDASNKPHGILWSANTHDEVAEKFCDGAIDFYVGDIEIIATHARENTGCQWSSGARSFTNDRYAIFADIDYGQQEKALLIGRFFEVLNREIATSDSLLDRAYIATFGAAPRSQKLDLFFWSMRGEP
ncbi:MAG: hypothetical protein AAFY74_10620 [Pseudomonadota bacterium]